MKTKKLAAALIAATVGRGLAACGGAPAQTPGGGSSTASGPVSITFQSLSDQPGAIAATKEIVEAWNTANPTIKVETIQAGWDGVFDKLTTQFSGKSAPDVIHYEAASILPFAADGYLRDLSKDITPAAKAEISDAVWDSVTYDGQIVGVPTEMQTYVVFANKKLLADAGVTVPTGDKLEWADFAQMAQQATKGDVKGLGWGLKSPTATMMALGPINGAAFFTGAGDKVDIAVGENELALPKAIKGMADAGSLDKTSLTQSGGDVLKGFYAGKYAMTVMGSYQAANIAKDAPAGFEWAELPPLAGTKGPGQAANPQTLSVNIDSKHGAEAAKFVEFFTKPENMAKLNTADALIPASKTAREQILKSTGGKDGWDMTLKSGESLTSAPYLKANNYAQWKDTVATPAFQKFLTGQIDEAGLKTALESGWKR